MTNNIVVIGTILLLSLILALIQYGSSLHYDPKKDEKKSIKNAPWQWKFIEVWNRFINMFLGGLIGYYFILVRWKQILKGGNLTIADFVVFIIFSMCLLGWFPYLLKNITMGITAILKRVLK